jgi:hypothetical protein
MDTYEIHQLIIQGEENDFGIVDRATLQSRLHQDDPLEKIDSNQLSHYHIYSYQHVLEVLRNLSQYQLEILPVLDADNNFLGALQLRDVAYHISQWAIVQEPGAIIVLKVNWKHYSLNEISAVVESNEFRILGSYLNNAPEDENVLVTLKINQVSVPSIVRGFERFGYNVLHVFQGEARQEGKEKQHYDALMRYLEI